MHPNFLHRSISENFPLLHVEDGFIMSRHGDVTLGFEVTLPSAYSTTPSGYDSLVGSFEAALRCLDPWTVVHKQEIYSYRRYAPELTGGFLHDSFERHFEGRPFLTQACRIWLTFSRESTVMQRIGRTGFFGYSVNAEPASERFPRYRSQAREFASVLGSSGRVVLRPLGDDDLLGPDGGSGILQQWWERGGMQSDIDDGDGSRVRIGDDVMEAYEVCDADCLLRGSIFASTRVDGLSTSVSEVSLSTGSPLGIMLDCEHVVNSYYVTVGQDRVSNDLRATANKMGSMSLRDNYNRIHGQAIEGFLDDMVSGMMLPVLFHMNVQVWGDPAGAADRRDLVATALSSMGLRATRALQDCPVLFWAACPGGGAELGRENWMTHPAGAVLALTPVDGFESGIRGGAFRVADRIRHTPLDADLQDVAFRAGLTTNYNAFVAGTTGSGKSFTMNRYFQSCYDKGDHVFIIDAGDSYEGLCGIVREESGGRDGTYMTWDGGRSLSFCPFTDVREWIDGERLCTDNGNFQFFRTFLMRACSDGWEWTEERRNILDSFLVGFIASLPEDGSVPTFDDYFRYLEDRVAPAVNCTVPSDPAKGDNGDGAWRHGYMFGKRRVTPATFDIDRFLNSLSAYSGNGSYAALLNGDGSVDIFSSRFTVVEVDALSRDDAVFYSLCILCIMNAFDRKMRTSDGTFKVLGIDEAWLAIANETMAPYLASVFRTARKYSTQAIVITQSVEDIVGNSVIKRAIIDNCAMRILLGQRDNVGHIDEVAALMGLGDMERALALSVGGDVDRRFGDYRQVFIKYGDRRSMVVSIEVSPQQAMAFESNKNRKKGFLSEVESFRAAGSATPTIDAICKLTRYER